VCKNFLTPASNLRHLLLDIFVQKRVAVTEKYRPYYEEKAKENKSLNGGDKKSELPKSASPINPIHTTDELSKLANVGHTLYHQAKTILDSKNEEVKQIFASVVLVTQILLS
jgi:hypothetical protein